MSNSTQNDWEKQDVAYWINELIEKRCDRVYCRMKIEEIQAKERADARKEVIEKILFTMPKAKRKDKEGFPESANMAYYLGEFDYEIQMRQLLTTLREEDGK